MTADRDSRADEPNAQGQTFREHITAEAIRRPEIRAQVSEILANMREMDQEPLWAQYVDEHGNYCGDIHKPGVSEVNLYWRVWRIEDQPDGFECLCGSCAPLSEVEQLIRDVRPARARDFMYANTLPPTCARCGWRNESVHAERKAALRG